MENSEMKDRIAHIIRAKNLTAAEFALQLGIQPSNISHLLSGRNNPSLDFVKKLKETFPEYCLEWIIFGRGPITESEPMMRDTPVAPVQDAEVLEKEPEETFEGTLFGQPIEAEMPQKQTTPTQKAELKQIILVYSDHTFEQILPR